MSLNENSYTLFPNISCNSDEAISNAISHIFNPNTFINVENIVSNIETTDRYRYFNNNNINNTPLNDINNQNIEILIDNNKERRKYDFDSSRKKLKHLVLKSLLGFINNKIDNNEHKIKLLEYEKTKDTKIKFEKSFMYKTIGDIFSNTISKKYTSLTKDERENNNINNIDILKKNEEIKDILDLTFVQCLNHFIGKNPNVLLNGMKTLEEYKLNDKKHEEKLKDYGLKYENSVLTSKERNRKKKKNN